MKKWISAFLAAAMSLSLLSRMRCVRGVQLQRCGGFGLSKCLGQLEASSTASAGRTTFRIASLKGPPPWVWWS